MKTDQYGDPALLGWLVSLRNVLIEGRCTAHTDDDLQNAISLIADVEIEETRAVLQDLLPRVRHHVREGRYEAAGRILNLVHNMPLTTGHQNHWDIDYFLGSELASFLEHYREIPDARQIVLRICGEIARSQVLSAGKWARPT